MSTVKKSDVEKRYRSIIIDPEKRIVEVVPTTASLEEIHTLVNAKTLDHFRIAEFDKTFDYGWVDDGGLSRGEPIYAFLFSIRKDPIAGRCLLLGVDKDERGTVDAGFNIDILKESIEWLGLIKPEVTWDHQENSDVAIVTYSRVKTT